MRGWALLISGLGLQGCLSYTWNAMPEPGAAVATRPADPGAPSAETPLAAPATNLVVRALNNHDLEVTNKGLSVEYVSPQRSVVEFGGRSYMLVSGETRVLEANLQQRDIPVAPGAITKVSLYRPDGLVPDDMPVRFRVAVADGAGAMVSHVIVDVERFRFSTEVQKSDRVWCYVTAIFYGGYCWFISPDEADWAAARERANKLAGKNVTVEYAGRD